MMSRFLLSVAALAMSAPAMSAAIAQDAAPAAAPAAAAATPKVGQLLRDAAGRRLAPIESIRDDAVFVILDMHMYRIPTNTLSMSDKGLQTSLKRADLR
jgi:hypothetical protein